MIKNYLKTAFRNFFRHKLFTLINLAGLSIGISAALVIYLIVQYDFSFEHFQKDRDRTYRVVTDISFSGNPWNCSGVPPLLPAAVRKEVTGIAESSFFISNGASKVKVPATDGSTQIISYPEHAIGADDHYFSMFPFYQWIAGSPATALNAPNQVVLSESRANIYFPHVPLSALIGRTVIYDDSLSCTITGIVKDAPDRTDFIFSEFISLGTYKKKPENWGSIGSGDQYFVRLIKGVRPAKIEAQLAGLRKKHSDDQRHPESKTAHHLQPLTALHFDALYGSYGVATASKPALYGMLAVAFFLLALGCINFINLTTAQAVQRAKEIGIRKTLGSSRWQLITQFIGETALLTLASALLSLALMPLLLKVFSDYIPQGLTTSLRSRPDIFAFLLILTAILSLISGFYPSLLLSRFAPVSMLKNQIIDGTSTTRKALLRKTLTVFQFVIAQVFIIMTLVVAQQIRYSLNMNMGFRKDAIVYFATPYENNNDKQKVLLNKLHAIPGTAQITVSSAPPVSGNKATYTMTYMNVAGKHTADVEIKYIDTAYISLYNLKMLAGHGPTVGIDTPAQLVINRACAQQMGFTDVREAVDKYFNQTQLRVVGVVEDFHQASLRDVIKPLALEYSKNENCVQMSLPVKDHLATWPGILAKTEAAYKELYPKSTFAYQFFDEDIAQLYKQEQNIARLLRWATALTIFISCLGLLGLVIYAANTRTKEIGIRKVMGASVTQIVHLLSKDFVKLVLIAFLIAVPIGWRFAHQWLQDFAYQADISWLLYVTSGLAMLFIAMLTLGVHTIRAANANPVNSLRNE